MRLTPKDLLDQLTQIYDVICFVDLAEITKNPGRVFRILQTYHNDSFDQNQRLIFYTNFQIDIDLLKHIKDACYHVDVSPSFLLFCSKDDILSTLIEVFGNKDFPKSFLVDVSSQPLEKSHRYPYSLCPQPWSHLTVTPQGEIKPCCVNKDSIGHINDQSLKEVFQGKEMEKLRAQFIRGERPSSCNRCWQIEEHGGISSRQTLIKSYKIDFLDQWIDDPQIRSLDLKPGNTCNFKCRICRPSSSSSIAAEMLTQTSDRDELFKIKNLIQLSKWIDNKERDFTQELIDLCPDLINIDFFGGEPFLLKSLPRILDSIIQSGHADHIRLHFNTNASVFPDNLLERFSKFQHVDIGLSIDDIEQRFEYQRGSKWPIIENNINRYLNIPRNRFSLSIYPVINVQNVLYLDQLIEWCDNKKIMIFAEYLESPSYLSISNLTSAARDLVLDKFKNNQHPLITSIKNKLNQSSTSNGKEFIKMMTDLDRVRKQNFAEHHYEIAKAMGYVV